MNGKGWTELFCSCTHPQVMTNFRFQTNIIYLQKILHSYLLTIGKLNYVCIQRVSDKFSNTLGGAGEVKMSQKKSLAEAIGSMAELGAVFAGEVTGEEVEVGTGEAREQEEQVRNTVANRGCKHFTLCTKI